MLAEILMLAEYLASSTLVFAALTVLALAPW
jgi:hypothetical protein